MSTPKNAPRRRRRLPPPGSNAPRVALEPQIDLGAAVTLHEALVAARGHDVVLDGQNVRHLGAAGLQVLIAARRGWAKDRRALSIEAPSEAFVVGLERLGATMNEITVEGGR